MGVAMGVAPLPLTLWLNPPQIRGLGAIPLRCSSPAPDTFSCLRILSAPPAAQGIYLLGSGAWRVIDVVRVEKHLEVPVVHSATSRIAVVAAVVDKTLRHSLFIRRIQNPLKR